MKTNKFQGQLMIMNKQEKWKKAFFAVSGHKLYGFEDPKFKKRLRGAEWDMYKLRDPYNVAEANAKNEDHLFAFQIIFSTHDIVILGASSVKMRGQWMDCLQAVIRQNLPKNSLLAERDAALSAPAEQPVAEMEDTEENDAEKILEQTVEKQLDELDLSGLELEDGILEKFKGGKISERIPKIPIVDLSLNHFTVVPQDILNLRYVVELCLSGCKLAEWPVELRKLRKLTDLNLGGNLLRILPEEIGYLTNLEKLILKKNQITHINESIGSLRQLEELDLSGNPRFRNIPPALGECRNLRVLRIRDCNLPRLPNEITFLGQLEDLEICNNTIQDLPAEMGRLLTLTSMDVSNNRLLTLPASLGLCYRLLTGRKLNLNGNPFQDHEMVASYEHSGEALLEYLEELMVRLGGFPRYDDPPYPEKRHLPPWNDLFEYEPDLTPKPVQPVQPVRPQPMQVPSGLDRDQRRRAMQQLVYQPNKRAQPRAQYKRSMRVRKKNMREPFDFMVDTFSPDQESSTFDSDTKESQQHTYSVDTLPEYKEPPPVDVNPEVQAAMTVANNSRDIKGNNLVLDSNYVHVKKLQKLIQSLPAPAHVAPASGFGPRQHQQQLLENNMDLLGSMLEEYGSVSPRPPPQNPQPRGATSYAIPYHTSSYQAPRTTTPPRSQTSGMLPSNRPTPSPRPPGGDGVSPRQLGSSSPPTRPVRGATPRTGGGGGGRDPLPMEFYGNSDMVPEMEQFPASRVRGPPRGGNSRNIPENPEILSPPLPEPHPPKIRSSLENNLPENLPSSEIPFFPEDRIPNSEEPARAISNIPSEKMEVMVTWATTTIEVTQARLGMIVRNLLAIEKIEQLPPFVNKLKLLKPEIAKISQFVSLRSTQPPKNDDKFERAKMIVRYGLNDCSSVLQSLREWVDNRPQDIQLSAAVQVIRAIKVIVES